MCFIFHKWTKWKLTGGEFVKQGIISGTNKAYGKQQECECLKCGKLQSRITWVGV